MRGTQATEGFRKAFKKEESIFCNIPSSKTPGLNLVSRSALKKSRFFPVTMEGTKSDRSASSLSNLDCINRTVFDPSDLPVRVRPNQVMECDLMVGIILVKTKSRRRKRFQRELPEFQGFGILPPAHVVMPGFFHLAFGPILDSAAWRVDLLVSPLHKLAAVVRLGPEIPNELVALCPLLLVYGELLLEAGFDDPVADLPASHPVHHTVERGKAQSRAAAPLKTHRITTTRCDAIPCRGLVPVKVDVLEDVKVCRIPVAVLWVL